MNMAIHLTLLNENFVLLIFFIFDNFKYSLLLWNENEFYPQNPK